MKNNKKTSKWIQKLLYDTRETDKRLIGMNETTERQDKLNEEKHNFTEIIAGNGTNMGK